MKDKYDYEYLLLNDIHNKINKINIENMELKYQLKKYRELYSYNSTFCNDYNYFENKYRMNIEMKNNIKNLYKLMKNKNRSRDNKCNKDNMCNRCNRDNIEYIYL